MSYNKYMEKYEIIKFTDQDFKLDVNVSPYEETVWLTLDDLSLLFERDKSVISRHIKNIFADKELDESTSIAKNAIQINGQIHYILYFNLEVIISVGYRVKSKRGVTFRRWASSILRDYLLKGYALSKDRTLVTNENYIQLINDVNSLKNDVEAIKVKISNNTCGAFIVYEGEYYDGYSFINNLIKKANNEIVLIDGYADDLVFDFFIGTKTGIKKTIICHKLARFTNEVTSRFEKEYGIIDIKEDKSYHDRFLIIDSSIYLLGTSLNSIGNKTSCVIKLDGIDIKSIMKYE